MAPLLDYWPEPWAVQEPIYPGGAYGPLPENPVHMSSGAETR